MMLAPLTHGADLIRLFAQKCRNFELVAILNAGEQISRTLDEKSGLIVSAVGVKSAELTNELARITDQAANMIEDKGLTYARSLRDNSQDIAQKINDASEISNVIDKR